MTSQQNSAGFAASPGSALSMRENLPVWTKDMGDYPREGCYNHGFDECVDFGSVVLGGLSTPWGGTKFSDCVFPNGLMQPTNGTYDGVRVDLSDCVVESLCKLGKKSRVVDSQFTGSLSLGSDGRVSNSTIDENLQLPDGARAEDVKVGGQVIISGYGVSFSTEHPVPGGVNVNSSSIGGVHIRLGKGGVVRFNNNLANPDVVIEGDVDHIAVAYSSSDADSALAEAMYEVAVSRDRDDPLWVSARNTHMWASLVDIGEFNPRNPGSGLPSEESILLGLAIHHNP